MYGIKNALQKNPVQISGVVVAGMSGLQLFGVVELTGDQVAWVGSFTVLVLGLFITGNTVNVAKLDAVASEVEKKANEGFALATDMAVLEATVPAGYEPAHLVGNVKIENVVKPEGYWLVDTDTET